MNRRALAFLVLLASVVAFSSPVAVADLVSRKTSTGTVVGYKDTPLLPSTGDKYCVHDPDRPIPKVVVPRSVGTPLTPAPVPADAVVLFGGKSKGHWKESTWTVKDGDLVCGRESLTTKRGFGSCQLHIEFATPAEASKNFMNRGNSGVIFMGKYEVQIFDSWHKHPQQIYPDGQAASIYGQTPPLVNASMPPGEWQAYDIVFTAPVFDGETLRKPATITMFHNGILVHCAQTVTGPMAHKKITPYTAHPARLPLVLQGHGSELRFRNIWIREVK